MKELTVLIQLCFMGQRVTILTVRHRYRSTSPVHSVMITAEELEKIFSNKMAGYSYTRINNPTIESFEKRMGKA